MATPRPSYPNLLHRTLQTSAAIGQSVAEVRKTANDAAATAAGAERTADEAKGAAGEAKETAAQAIHTASEALTLINDEDNGLIKRVNELGDRVTEIEKQVYKSADFHRTIGFGLLNNLIDHWVSIMNLLNVPGSYQTRHHLFLSSLDHSLYVRTLEFFSQDDRWQQTWIAIDEQIKTLDVAEIWNKDPMDGQVFEALRTLRDYAAEFLSGEDVVNEPAAAGSAGEKQRRSRPRRAP